MYRQMTYVCKGGHNDKSAVVAEGVLTGGGVVGLNLLNDPGLHRHIAFKIFHWPHFAGSKVKPWAEFCATG